MSRKKFAELLKLLLAIAFGYALKVLQSNCSCLNCNTNPVIDCTKCTTCFEKLIDRVTSSPCQTILPANDSNEIQLKEPFKPQSMYEVLRYDYFNKTHIFNNFDDDPRIWLQHHQSADIKDIIGQSVLLYSKAFQHTWRFNKLLNGYRRFDPLRGEEYIIDLELVSEAQDSPWYKAKELVYRSQRFEIVKPFMKAKLLSYRHFLSDTTIYFILPLTHVNERFNTFIQNLIDVAWSKDDANICLIIVFFLESKDSSAKKNVAILRKAMYDIQQKYVKANIRIIETQQEFSRGIGLHIAAQQLHNDSLLFFCDVDVVFTKEFINRCRLNSVLGKQVYYPMIFAQYNPALIYKYAPPETNNVMDMNKYTGFWIYYGFGMACMYNEDYKRVGGFNLNIKGWGGEDVDLYIKHVKSDLQVLRAADPGLIHIYHVKSCNTSLPSNQLRMCLAAASEGLGFKQILGKFILSSQELLNLTLAL